MQASQAKNETRLPRAVLKMSDALKAKIAARDEPKPDPAVPAPSAEPTAKTADTVDPKPQAAPEPPADPRESDPAYWKHRFQATAGRLRVREDEHRETVGELRQQITELQGQIRTLQDTQKSSATIDPAQFLSAEQIEMLGEDEAKAVAKAARTAAQLAVKEAIDAEVKPLREASVAADQQRVEDRKARFYTALEERVPDWEAIDKGDDWKAWLAGDDESGLERQEILDRHVSKGDAGKVAAMFEAFQKTKARPVPPVTPSGTGSNGGGEPPPQPNARDLRPPTAAEIKDFYTRSAAKRRGQPGYVTDQERAEFEARLKLRAPR